METPASKSERQIADVDLALCRATLYSALALGFRPPTEETMARLISPEGAVALAEAADLLETNCHSGLGSAVRRPSLHEPSLEKLSALHRRLFGHTAQGSVPVYETEYGTEALFQQPQALGDLMGFYQAFGLALNGEEHERPDHVSCECEFLCFLALKEAYALEKGDPSMLEETRKAARLFLRDHLGRFVPAFSRKLIREDRGGFYGALGELCLSLVTLECARLNVPLGAGNLALRPATDDRVPMACGTDSECPLVSAAHRVKGFNEEE